MIEQTPVGSPLNDERHRYELAVADFQSRLLEKPFEDPESLERIFHVSRYSPEKRKVFEFVGDSSFEYRATHILYELFPDATGHTLDILRSMLVSDAMMARVALATRMHTLLRLPASSARRTGTHIEQLGNMMERFMYSLDREQGITAVDAFVRRHMIPQLHSMLEAFGLCVKDNRTGEIDIASDTSRAKVTISFEQVQRGRGKQWRVDVRNVEGGMLMAAHHQSRNEALRKAISAVVHRHDWVPLGADSFPVMPYYPFAEK